MERLFVQMIKSLAKEKEDISVKKVKAAITGQWDAIYPTDGNYISALFNRQEIIGMITETIARICEDPTQDVYMIFQPTIEDVFAVLNGLTITANCRFHHLICLDSGEDAALDNLKILKQVMTLTFSPVFYDVKYYYGNVSEHINSMSVLPNVIFTEDMLITFDSELKHGLVTSNPEMRKVYKAVYNDMSAKSRVLIKRYSSVEEIIRFYYQNDPSDWGINFTPCVTYSFTEDRLQQLLNTELLQNTANIKNILHLIGKNSTEKLSKGMSAVSYFFVKEGFDYFMETGYVTEYPREFYRSVPQELRIELMKEQVEQIKDKRINAVLLKENGLKIGRGLCLDFHIGKCAAFIANDDEGKMIMMEVRENGILKTIQDYIEYLYTGTKIYSREEAIQWMEQRIAFWEDKYSNQ